jgi:hypothetical protein
MSPLLRAGIGAGIGAFMGRNDGWSGMLGGAAAGAAMGGFAGGRIGGWGGYSKNMIRGTRMARNAIGWGLEKGAMNGRVGAFMQNTGVKAYRGLQSARSWSVANKVGINKWGGRAANALGMGAAGYIGSSILSSNGGF